jgi:EAL domain-containing protein (putative c-di-GMP-specific phosphodiesterase class I)
VETAEQLSLLEGMDCDQIQGFLISPAVPGADFERLVVERAAAAAAA